MDSNHDKELQRLLCYHYTTGQTETKVAFKPRQRKGKVFLAFAPGGGKRASSASNCTDFWRVVSYRNESQKTLIARTTATVRNIGRINPTPRWMTIREPSLAPRSCPAPISGRMHILPLEKMQEITQPAKSLPRPKNIMADFLDACRDGRKDTAASFDYGARLTEFTLLGNLAQIAGSGKKVEWDGPSMVVKNLKELNRWVKCPRRSGWV